MVHRTACPSGGEGGGNHLRLGPGEQPVLLHARDRPRGGGRGRGGGRAARWPQRGGERGVRRGQFRQVAGDEDVHALRLEQHGAQRGERGDGGGAALGRAELRLEIREEGLLPEGVAWRDGGARTHERVCARLGASHGHVCAWAPPRDPEVGGVPC